MKSFFDNNMLKIDYFCDNDVKKHGKYLGGVKILSVDELISLGNEVTIIITSTYFKEIYFQLKQLDLRIYFGFPIGLFQNIIIKL